MKMNKVSKVTAFVLLVLVATTVSATISLVNATTANAKLRKEISTYKDYYKSSEALFNEIEDYNENLFDTDRAVDYYNSKKNISVSRNDSSRPVKDMKYKDSMDSLAFSKHIDLSNIDGDNFYSREINEGLTSGKVNK